jgi:SAM-dependent methyltransferase
MLAVLARAKRSLVATIYRSRRANVFRTIYKRNKWGSHESRSGSGSTLSATANLRVQLPRLIEGYGVRSMLDAPCGDFHWMNQLGVEDLVDRYCGFDIVPELIAANRRTWGSDRVRFKVADLVKVRVPAVDLILCRHLLIHLPLEDALQVLRNFSASGSRYLLITDQPQTAENVEILWTGSFRPVNLALPPFSLPEPLAILEDRQGKHDATVLSLFDLAAIAERLGMSASLTLARS